jgi:glucose/arabinose dehydrogenase
MTALTKGVSMLGRRTVLAAAAAGSALPLLTGPPAAAALRQSKVLVRGMRVPWGLDFLPNGDALVTERTTGRVHRVRRTGGSQRVGRIDGVDLSPGAGEGGLLGLAVSPTFSTDRLVYLYFTSDSDNRLISMRYVDGRLTDRQNLLTGIRRSSTHNGGRLAFGPQGHLFVTTGDANVGSAPQDTGVLEGKILRLNPDGSAAAGNPFGNRVWSYGHRNVQGIAWDPRGRMWATEFGQNRTDELNRIVPGGNYGWPDAEGSDGSGGYRDPLAQWSPTSTCSPSGVAVAGGRAWVGALRGECVYSVKLNAPNKGQIRRHLRGELGRIRTVALAPDGALWVTTSNRDGRGDPRRPDDRVVRLAF